MGLFYQRSFGSEAGRRGKPEERERGSGDYSFPCFIASVCCFFLLIFISRAWGFGVSQPGYGSGGHVVARVAGSGGRGILVFFYLLFHGKSLKSHRCAKKRHILAVEGGGDWN